MSAKRCLHIIFRGNVQGVGFRYTAERVAIGRGLTGWVRNCDDGSFEAVCEGPEDAITAGLGLFGLALFLAERRTKEIGIRKVLGASVPEIIFLLSSEFVKWVAVAIPISWPLAFYAMHRWLQGFAYRTRIGIGVFALSSLMALLLALATVSFHSIRAARANPVDSLRYE